VRLREQALVLQNLHPRGTHPCVVEISTRIKGKGVPSGDPACGRAILDQKKAYPNLNREITEKDGRMVINPVFTVSTDGTVTYTIASVGEE